MESEHRGARLADEGRLMWPDMPRLVCGCAGHLGKWESGLQVQVQVQVVNAKWQVRCTCKVGADAAVIAVAVMCDWRLGNDGVDGLGTDQLFGNKHRWIKDGGDRGESPRVDVAGLCICRII